MFPFSRTIYRGVRLSGATVRAFSLAAQGRCRMATHRISMGGFMGDHDAIRGDLMGNFMFWWDMIWDFYGMNIA